MNILEIKEKQIEWARKHQIAPWPDRRDYVAELNDNLFCPLSPEQEKAFGGGAGGELDPVGGAPPKMNALHSSSALAVNVFACPATVLGNDEEYWNRLFRNQAVVSGIGNLECCFEKQLPVMDVAGHHPPHLDFFIADADGAIGVESKFTEHATPHENTISVAYFDHFPLWEKFPGLKEFARRIDSGEERFHYLNAAQLLKHTLGLISWQATCGNGDYLELSLVYLYFRHTGKTGIEHDVEVAQYAAAMRKVHFNFIPITCQEFIPHLLTVAAFTADPLMEKHAGYLLSRYL